MMKQKLSLLHDMANALAALTELAEKRDRRHEDVRKELRALNERQDRLEQKVDALCVTWGVALPKTGTDGE